jgi:nucleoside-diphosphate-sugar epimerase
MILMANSEVYGEAFNAGSGTSTSINKIYRLVAETLDSSIKPYYVDPVFEPPKTQGDISKAKRLLGWEPKVSLEEGLRRTIEGTVI